MQKSRDGRRGGGNRRGLRVNLISLGCPKNLVDSENILGRLGEDGLMVTPSAEDADVVVVNTCGFVESAKEESIQTILEACQLKETSVSPKKVVVTGCLGQRYGQELLREIPEIDAVIGLGEYSDIGPTLRQLVAPGAAGAGAEPLYRVGDPTKACQAEVGRFRLTPRHFAYIKISEGCDNPCTFCAIPAIRGRFRSKPIPVILEEARELVAGGAREIILISQDTTSYGVDLDGKFQFAHLLERLAEVDGLDWIRVLYAYPAFLTDDMIDALGSIDKVVKYLDMPLQHISAKMLRRMGRRMDESRTRALLERLRARVPGLYLRTTFIVGFPGEERHDQEVLLDFVREFEFERLGVFTFSPEDSTPAATFADQVPEEIAGERLEELMLAQQEVAFRQNRRRVGEEVDVLIDSIDGEAEDCGRSFGEAPEIDPCVFLPRASCRGESEPGLPADGFIEIPLHREPPRRDLQPGDLVKVRITGSREYDLLATPTAATPAVGHSPPASRH